MSSTFIPDPNDSKMTDAHVEFKDVPQPSDFNLPADDPAPTPAQPDDMGSIQPVPLSNTASLEASKKAKWDEMQTLMKESKEKVEYWYGMRWAAAFMALIPFFGVFGDLTI